MDGAEHAGVVGGGAVHAALAADTPATAQDVPAPTTMAIWRLTAWAA